MKAKEIKVLLKYLEKNKNPNLKKEVDYGFEYCLALINEYLEIKCKKDIK